MKHHFKNRLSKLLCITALLTLVFLLVASSAPPTPVSAATPPPGAEVVFGPEDGEVEAPRNDTLTSFVFANVEIANPGIEIDFENPFRRTDEPWILGLIFRNSGDSFYVLTVASDQQWELTLFGGGDSEAVDSGRIDEDINANRSNRLQLFVQGDNATLFINDEQVAEIDVSEHTDEGLVALLLTYDPDDSAVDSVPYEGFTIYDLENAEASTEDDSGNTGGGSGGNNNASGGEIPADAEVRAINEDAERIFGPQEGQMAAPEDSTYYYTAAEVLVQNFVVEIAVENPYARNVDYWDFSISFRVVPDGSRFYMLVIQSDYTWRLLLSDGTDFSQITAGSIINLDLDDNAVNRVRLVVQDTEGEFYVNDRRISTFRLRDLTDAGDIELAAGVFAGRGIP
jgi:hypothetical protein